MTVIPFVTPIIEEIFNESNQIFGASKINAILRNRGYVVADKTVAAIMHENGWFSVRGGAKAIYEMNKERKYSQPTVYCFGTKRSMD